MGHPVPQAEAVPQLESIFEVALMNAYLTERYGNPCRGCGYTWSADADVCRGMIEESPGRVAALLEGRDGSESVPELEWNARAYVAHMADNLRIWSERLAAVVLDPFCSRDPLRRRRSCASAWLPIIASSGSPVVSRSSARGLASSGGSCWFWEHCSSPSGAGAS